ncbi:alpha/beta hydrolase domain-containing protein [Aquabacter sp. P-9]|uniref:alpha/beta hydrolase domain-containing protein n=1 Tax=Aquabacter sediminis TaxID=3029197 RepID=UPI00237E4AE3|nr:alpha/beta hydrolase domain-containing protein [Aquabacter sp. P-9]MDE1568466.1 alpha/beta hydrolase domain-containing protein [Aquabacter sp. P-9]
MTKPTRPRTARKAGLPPRRTGALAVPLVLAASGALLGPAAAEVTRLEDLKRTPAYDGRSFGGAGAYEKIEARVHFAIDPKSERARKVAGIDKAPVNAKGEVEFSTEMVILAPLDAAAGARTLFYEVPNRGRNLSFPLLNAVTKAGPAFTVDDPGDGFLMRQGFTIVWSGWQTDLGDTLMDIALPVLAGVTAPSREEFIFEDAKPVSTAKLTYPAADLDPAKATLTVRAKTGDARATPAGLSFRFVDAQTVEITRPAGLDGGAIYEFIYPARDAVPAGLGFIATADLVSFLRGHGPEGVKSPVGPIDHTIGLGISQSGRFLRDLVYQGFNADAGGKPVFDGVMPHIAGSRKTFTNDPFAQPGRYSRQHEDHDYPGDQFPFTYVDMTDPVSGRTDGILKACGATQTCPKVIHTDTSTEFWQGRAALVSTAPDGTALTMPETVRLFFLAGAPHFNAWGASSRADKTCLFPTNPLSVGPTLRALTVAMKDWVRGGKAPRASVYPAGKEALVAPETLGLPRIEGTVPRPPVNGLNVRDTAVPPRDGAAYAILVPKVDGDGMALGGVREVPVAAPLGTYWGWNLRREGFAPGELCSLTGSFVAFPKTQLNSDSRAPLSARYGSAQDYEAALAKAADGLVAEGLMLPEDRAMVLKAAPAFPAAQ